MEQITYILKINEQGKLEKVSYPILQDTDGTLFELENENLVLVDDVNGEEITV